jgi:hypothetical protein
MSSSVLQELISAKQDMFPAPKDFGSSEGCVNNEEIFF